MKTKLFLKVLLGFTTIVSASHAEEIGSVDTKFKYLGPDHKIVIEAFDDPKIEGITCHLSRSKKGGLKGMIGVTEETSDASIACRQVGPIRVVGELKEGEKVFRESRSLIFKTLQVVRFFDKKRQTFPQFRGHLVKQPPSSLRTRPGSHSRGSNVGASDYRRPRYTRRWRRASPA